MQRSRRPCFSCPRRLAKRSSEMRLLWCDVIDTRSESDVNSKRNRRKIVANCDKHRRALQTTLNTSPHRKCQLSRQLFKDQPRPCRMRASRCGAGIITQRLAYPAVAGQFHAHTHHRRRTGASSAAHLATASPTTRRHRRVNRAGSNPEHFGRVDRQESAFSSSAHSPVGHDLVFRVLNSQLRPRVLGAPLSDLSIERQLFGRKRLVEKRSDAHRLISTMPQDISPSATDLRIGILHHEKRGVPREDHDPARRAELMARVKKKQNVLSLPQTQSDAADPLAPAHFGK